MSDTWLFLRGLTREQLHWGNFLPFFKEQVTPNVFCIDYPGVGEFYQQESPWSIAAIADHVLIQLDQHKIEKCHVLAHSMGGMVSAAMLYKQPNRFKKIIWMNTSFSNVSPWYQRLNISGAVKHLRSAVFYQNLYLREKTTYQLTTNLHHDVSLVDEWVDIQKKHPVSRSTFFRQLWAASQFAFYPQLQMQILLLGALKDHFVSPQCTVDIADSFGFPYFMHPEAGHDLPVDAPQWVIDQIKQWL
ncbi:MAG: alpha/beta fold hydrolase [Bdellovibrionota bacterium]